jgi:hypothetical protein
MGFEGKLSGERERDLVNAYANPAATANLSASSTSYSMAMSSSDSSASKPSANLGALTGHVQYTSSQINDMLDSFYLAVDRDKDELFAENVC